MGDRATLQVRFAIEPDVPEFCQVTALVDTEHGTFSGTSRTIRGALVRLVMALADDISECDDHA